MPSESKKRKCASEVKKDAEDFAKTKHEGLPDKKEIKRRKK